MKREKCIKCGRGYKLLTDKGKCFYCDMPNWQKQHKSKGKGEK